MKDKTACFTGHRKVLEPQKVYQQLIATLEKYILEGYIYFGAGGALGFDTLAAEAVLELKNKFPHIKLILVLPCKNQTAKWNKNDITLFILMFQVKKIKKTKTMTHITSMIILTKKIFMMTTMMISLTIMMLKIITMNTINEKM